MAQSEEDESGGGESGLPHPGREELANGAPGEMSPAEPERGIEEQTNGNPREMSPAAPVRGREEQTNGAPREMSPAEQERGREEHTNGAPCEMSPTEPDRGRQEQTNRAPREISPAEPERGREEQTNGAPREMSPKEPDRGRQEQTNGAPSEMSTAEPERGREEQGNGTASEMSAAEHRNSAAEAQVVEQTGGREMAGEAEEKKGKRNGKPITEKWRPVYDWLGGLKQQEVVKVNQISEWLEAHEAVRERLRRNHTNEHIFNYIQKCHTRMIVEPRKKSSSTRIDTVKQGMPALRPSGRFQRPNKNVAPTEPNNVRAEPMLIRKYRKRRWGLVNSEASGSIGAWPSRFDFLANAGQSTLDKGKQIAEQESGTDSSVFDACFSTEADKVRRRFEMLAALRSELLDVLANFKEAPGERFGQIGVPGLISRYQTGNRKSRTRDPGGVIGWSFSETSSGMKNEVSLRRAMKKCAERIEAYGSELTVVTDRKTNVLNCVMDRERGGNSETVAWRPHDVGRHGRRWTTFVNGWKTLETQFKGPVSWLQQNAYSSWCASWCAYTSSVALAPLGGVDQGVQKVLDLRLHPGGLPQLVCSCNAAPNELLIYNLMNGRARELPGHNCQIQAVEYALDGERIISCGTNIMKVWDSASGACVFTMGPPVESEGTPGHKKKISAMAVHWLQSCLVATSGGEGESEILLWNIRTGDLVSDLNAEIRRSKSNLQSMDALQFCHQNLLICGSDSSGNQPAVVQIWDVDALKDLMTYPASDSYITCLNTDPQGSTIITGAGDGSVGLFDIRSGGSISRLPLGKGSEATSVAFSACGTYFHSSSSANHTLVWDKRMMPMEPGLMSKDRPVTIAKLNSRSSRPLHCLSHGDPMPTTQNAGQLPGFVDEGDGGVNDARWCQSAPVLVTASGNGSIAIWDVTLGKPCLRNISSHSRCINTITISSDDQLICSGGDDQKVVLYQNGKGKSTQGWRLTHPLSDEMRAAVARSESLS